jgi:hypothetical protein
MAATDQTGEPLISSAQSIQLVPGSGDMTIVIQIAPQTPLPLNVVNRLCASRSTWGIDNFPSLYRERLRHRPPLPPESRITMQLDPDVRIFQP